MQRADTATASRSDRPAARRLAAATVLVGVALLIAACGGSASPGVANTVGSKSTSSQAATTSSAGGAVGGGPVDSSAGASSGRGSGESLALGGSRQNALKFSACMRANGVPNFPDPNSQGVIQFSGIDTSSPAFQSAQKKCAKYRGKGGSPSPAQQAQMQAQALKFSACMRTHGVPKFPDPQFSGGGVRISIGSASGIDPRSAIFQAAQKTCGSLLPGLKPGAGSPPASGR
jgi:hypothetical protein